MRSFGSLFNDALYPRTRVYHDANGRFKGTSTDITPWYLLIGRLWGITLWLYIILLPLLAPVYFAFAHWYCRRYDAENLAEDPKGWPQKKKQILKNHRNILIGWIMFMLLGWFTDWGQPDYSKESDSPSIEHTSKWGTPDYVDPYKQYKETHNIK